MAGQLKHFQGDSGEGDQQNLSVFPVGQSPTTTILPFGIMFT